MKNNEELKDNNEVVTLDVNPLTYNKSFTG